MKQLIQILSSILLLSYALSCTSEKPIEANNQALSFKVNGESFDMMFVEGGSFTMGCTKEQGSDCEDDEMPTHEETLSSFYIGKYEVTQRLWTAVMGKKYNKSHNTGCDDCPVENVSWEDVYCFINKLRVLTNTPFRMPTQAEWEFAARGGKHSKGFKYSGASAINEVAWYVKNHKETKFGKLGTTHPVGTKAPNELGLYDMSGNVWEWCGDLYTQEYVRNGKTVHSDWPYPGMKPYFRRVIRGGSWGGTAMGCRVSYRDFDTANYHDEYGGFRLVLSYTSDSTQVITNK